MQKRRGLIRHRSNGHCKVRSLSHRVKCDYSVQRIVTSTNNLTASKHVTMQTYNMQLTNNKKQWAVWRTNTKNAKLTITLQEWLTACHRKIVEVQNENRWEMMEYNNTINSVKRT